MNIKISVLVLIMFAGTQAFSQISAREYFLSGNMNFYLPGSNSGKAIHPALWYGKETDPKFLFGGVGVGFSMIRSLKEKVSLKAQSNISRYKYWNEPIDLRDEANNPLGTFITSSTDYALLLSGSIHYFLSDKFSIGTGLGVHTLLISTSHSPDLRSRLKTMTSKGPLVRNRFYKPLMPVVPLEISIKDKKKLFSIRYEYALLNRLKKDLAAVEKENYSVLVFEMGFRIK